MCEMEGTADSSNHTSASRQWRRITVDVDRDVALDPECAHVRDQRSSLAGDT